MDYQDNNTESRKNKHLNFKERMTIEIRFKDGFSIYKIAKELGLSINTITNEIKRGTTTQIIGKESILKYILQTLAKLRTNYLVQQPLKILSSTSIESLLTITLVFLCCL